MSKILDLTRVICLGPLAAALLLTGCSGPKDTHPPATATATATASANTDAQPHYATTREIAAMAPRTGTLTKRLSEFSGAFTTADGKGFILGDPAGEQWVWHFLCTLKEGQSCKFPDAFLNFVAAPYYGTAEEIAAMTPRAGTLAMRTPCSAYFTTADGKGFGIGDPGSGAQVSHFLWALEPGATCKFPDAFLDFQKHAPPDEP